MSWCPPGRSLLPGWYAGWLRSSAGLWGARSHMRDVESGGPECHVHCTSYSLHLPETWSFSKCHWQQCCMLKNNTFILSWAGRKILLHVIFKVRIDLERCLNWLLSWKVFDFSCCLEIEIFSWKSTWKWLKWPWKIKQKPEIFIIIYLHCGFLNFINDYLNKSLCIFQLSLLRRWRYSWNMHKN